MIKKIEIRLATPNDLKRKAGEDRYVLKEGQPYMVSLDGGDTVNGIYVLQGDEDPFILKKYLEKEQLFVPLNDFHFMNWIKESSHELQPD